MKTILVIEDESSSLKAFTVALERAGYHVCGANSSREATGLLQAILPNLILCDVMLPYMTGVAFCQRCQADPQHAHIPVILMSAIALASRQIGCTYAAFLEKPITIDLLYSTVAEVLARSTVRA